MHPTFVQVNGLREDKGALSEDVAELKEMFREIGNVLPSKPAGGKPHSHGAQMQGLGNGTEDDMGEDETRVAAGRQAALTTMLHASAAPSTFHEGDNPAPWPSPRSQAFIGTGPHMMQNGSFNLKRIISGRPKMMQNGSFRGTFCRIHQQERIQNYAKWMV
jgi:hypothetical protein